MALLDLQAMETAEVLSDKLGLHSSHGSSLSALLC